MGVMYFDFVYFLIVIFDIFFMVWFVIVKFCLEYFYYLIGIGFYWIRGIKMFVNKECWRIFIIIDLFEIDKVL